MSWRFPWLSSSASDFNFDLGVSFTPEQQERGGTYNFAHQDHLPEEAPGLSAFARRDGDVFHTNSTYARGLDPINCAYQLLDPPGDATKTASSGPWHGCDVTTPTTSEPLAVTSQIEL